MSKIKLTAELAEAVVLGGAVLGGGGGGGVAGASKTPGWPSVWVARFCCPWTNWMMRIRS